MPEYKVQPSGKIAAPALAGEKVVVKHNGSVIAHGKQVTQSGYVGGWKEYAGGTVTVTPL